MMEEAKILFLVLIRESKRLIFSKVNVALLFILYFLLPLITSSLIVVLLIIYILILLAIVLFSCGTSSKIFYPYRIFCQLLLLVSYWTTLLFIFFLVNELIWRDEYVVKILFFIISLLPPFHFAIKNLIESTLIIINGFHEIKPKDLKKNFVLTIVGIIFVVFLTDFIFSIIYSFVLLLGDLFGYLTDKPNFHSITEAINSGSFSAFFNLFYFTFSIHYAVPFSGDSIFVKFQELINNSTILMITQIIHMLFAKAVDLLILGVVANRFFTYYKAQQETEESF